MGRGEGLARLGGLYIIARSFSAHALRRSLADVLIRPLEKVRVMVAVPRPASADCSRQSRVDLARNCQASQGGSHRSVYGSGTRYKSIIQLLSARKLRVETVAFIRTVIICFGLLSLPIGGFLTNNALHADQPPLEPFAFRVVATGLDFPWEMTWGPDGFLWVTERVGKRVTRVRPKDGKKTTALTIDDVYQLDSGQDGVLGMALHPELLTGTGNDYVYLAYTYDADVSANGPNRRVKIRRYTYNAILHTLASPVDLITNLPASDDHNGGRMVLGPDGKLYYTIGDQGGNQFANFCNPIRSQQLPTAAQVKARDWTTYQGKVLRLNLDGSIPKDNPTIAGVVSHIYSYGHRNPQGIVFAPDGTLYACEHGPKTDDEVNLIEAGKNYGWPHVAGEKDDRAYVYGNWSASTGPPCSALTYSTYTIPLSVPQQKESEWSHPDFVPPLKTLYTVDNGYNFQDPSCALDEQYYLCWPTVAPSSLDFYTANENGIPGWENSLLMPTLKRGTLYRLKLSSDRRATVGDAIGYFKTPNRYRDIALSPDKRTLYLCTDSEGGT
ncbi:MAG: glucose/sorbosone family PQQ-dependent dehydrogenase, partial [Candidatus Binatia bacterium]